jgi:hypothetical protein
MAEYLIHDKDKAAFINKMNKILKQIKPGFELDTTNFIDVPGSNTVDDMSIYVTNNPIEEKTVDAMVSNKAFSYPLKKINLKEIAIASRL